MRWSNVAARAVAVAVIGWSLSLSPVAGQSGFVSGQPEGAVSEMSLIDALRQLSAVLPIDLKLDPAVAGASVSVDVSGLPPYEALRQVLLASGVDFVVAQRGSRFLVIAGNASAARASELGAVDSGEVRREEDESQGTAEVTPSAAPPDEREEAEDMASAEPDQHVRAPGEVTGEELVVLLTGPARADRGQPGLVDLPFPDVDGQPVRVVRPGGTPSAIELPFPDEAGNPQAQPASAAPRGFVELPFPDENGQPIRVPTTGTPAPASSPRPGVVPGRPPGGRD